MTDAVTETDSVNYSAANGSSSKSIESASEKYDHMNVHTYGLCSFCVNHMLSGAFMKKGERGVS